jgi:hypothetical protein
VLKNKNKDIIAPPEKSIALCSIYEIKIGTVSL